MNNRLTDRFPGAPPLLGWTLEAIDRGRDIVPLEARAVPFPERTTP